MRPDVRSFIIHQIGNGQSISVWFDIGPLELTVSKRDMARVGFSFQAKVSNLVEEGSLSWPKDWNARFNNIYITLRCYKRIKTTSFLWKDGVGNLQDFSVRAAWDSPRPIGNEMDWYSVLWYSQGVPKARIFNVVNYGGMIENTR